MKPIFLDLAGVAAATTLSKSSIQKAVRDGSFPKPRALSGRRVAWLLSEVEAWAQSMPASELLPPEKTGARRPAPPA